MIKCLPALLLLFCSVSGFAKEIALTFDDAPRGGSKYFSGTERAKALVKALKLAKVPRVAFFSNSEKLNAEGIERMKLYAKEGHFIGNHTHDHPNINEVTTEYYKESILKADEALSRLPGFIKWFRYPFLREGDTITKRDAIRDELEHRAYKNAYITVNNYDWYMDSLFEIAFRSGRAINETALRKTYVNVLIENIDFYDNMAREALGRSPKHVILLHENDLAALFIGDFVAAIQKRGWKIISPEEAYGDEISNYLTQNVSKNNPGRIGEIARDKAGTATSRTLWHESCDKAYLDRLFVKNGVYKNR